MDGTNNCTKMTVPDALSAQDVNTFAYKTIKDRLPVILAKAIDTICRRRKDLVELGVVNEEDAQAGEVETKEVIGLMSKLRTEIMTNKPLVEIISKGRDVAVWNKELHDYIAKHGQAPTWFESPWLYVEKYMYRRIQEAAELSRYLKRLDCFEENKQESLKGAIKTIKLLSRHLNQRKISIAKIEQTNDEAIKKKFIQFTQLALWGNKCDLSLSNGEQVSQSADPLQDLIQFRDLILCDDSEKLWAYLINLRETKPSGNVNLAIILDNAGFELFNDLCLCEFFHASDLLGENGKVTFYVKSMPWFVSDVMEKDFHWTLDWMTNENRFNNNNHTPNHDSGDLIRLANRWKGYMREKRWNIVDHPFWSYPFEFCEMQRVSPDLYAELSTYDLLMFKGDLNYRNLVSDRKWDITTDFETALRGFTPAPLVTLRTLKADVVVGLKDEEVLRKIKNGDMPEDWLISGDYAVIQFVGPKDK